MGKITGYATVGMVLALAKKMAIQYGALGIADVRTTPDGSDLIFIMSDGSQHRVELNFSANGVDYDDSVTKFNVNNVQAAIEALFSELQANAGGLTVLPYGNLDADTLAKVKANPQNYCIKGSDDAIRYYSEEDTNYIFYRSPKVRRTLVVSDMKLTQNGYRIYKVTGVIDNASNDIITFANTTTKVVGSILNVIGVQDITDKSIKTGTEIRKAITIRKWH